MRSKHPGRTRFEIALGITAFASAALADPVSTAPAPAAGPAQRAGAAIDAAVDHASHWIGEHSAEAEAYAKIAGAKAESWWNTARTQAWGLREPTRPAEVCLASPNPCGPPDPARPGSDMCIQWHRLSAGSADHLPARFVLLVHGLDEPGGMWNDLAPALFEHAYTVAKFDYPNDQHIADSADLLAGALKGLSARGVKRVDIVAHSMGGLVARDVLTRPAYYAGDGSAHAGLPQLGRLIVFSAPHLGSILAPLQPISEAREHLSRHIEGLSRPGDGWLHSYADGNGEAADDLWPDSPFLRELNSRPEPRNVAITNVIASLVTAEHQQQLVSLADSAAGLLGVDDHAPVRHAVETAFSEVGDGLVSAESAQWPGIADTVHIAGDHRGVIQRWRWLDDLDPDWKYHDRVPAGIPIILDRLARDR